MQRDSYIDVLRCGTTIRWRSVRLIVGACKDDAMKIDRPGQPMLHMECDVIEIPPSLMPSIDPDWSTVDSNGHTVTAKTMTWIIDWEGFVADGEEYSEGHYACPACGEEVTPGLKPPDPFGKHLPGQRHCYIDDREVTIEEFAAAAQAQGIPFHS